MNLLNFLRKTKKSITKNIESTYQAHTQSVQVCETTKDFFAFQTEAKEKYSYGKRFEHFISSFYNQEEITSLLFSDDRNKLLFDELITQNSAYIGGSCLYDFYNANDIDIFITSEDARDRIVKGIDILSKNVLKEHFHKPNQYETKTDYGGRYVFTALVKSGEFNPQFIQGKKIHFVVVEKILPPKELLQIESFRLFFEEKMAQDKIPVPFLGEKEECHIENGEVVFKKKKYIFYKSVAFF